jgi:MerR family copper efflux transcriptional regulator
MQISSVSRETGLSKDTIRYYEKLGLITLSDNERGVNRYRLFSRVSVNRLQLIQKLKAFGFTLSEIKLLFELDESESLQCSSITDLVNKKIARISQEIDILSAIKIKLEAGKETCNGNCKELVTLLQH